MSIFWNFLKAGKNNCIQKVRIGVRMNRTVPVKDAMTINVITLGSSASVTEVAELMVEKSIGSVVITENSEPIGIICERDLLEKVISSDLKPSEVTAGNIMVKPVITTDPETDMLDALRTMIEKDIQHLPVVEKGEIVGILTLQDILEITPEILETIPEFEEIEASKKEVEEPVCDICREPRKPLVQYGNKWICEKCREFLVRKGPSRGKE